MTPRELIQQLNELDEHSRIEAKTASELSRSVLETVCAFANEPGVVNGRHVIAAFVPEAEPSEKPIFSHNRPLPGAAFRRVGSSDVHCTDDDLAVFYQERRGDSFDSTVVRDADIAAIDPMALNEYRRLRAEANPAAEELRWNDDELLHEMNLAETKGSGIRVMRQLMNDAGLTPPTFESDRERNQFVVTLLFHHFLTPEDWVWLGRLQEAHLGSEDARALVFVREAGAIDNAAYRNLNRVDVLTASQRLRSLREAGLLNQKGKSSGTYYVPTPKLLTSWEGPMGATTPKMPGPPIQSGNPLAQPGNLPQDSADKVARLIPAPGLPADLEQDLANLKGKTAKSILEELAWRLCAWKALSTEELARFLRRNRGYVQDLLVTPMLRARRLAMTIPDQPNHPEQRYRASTPST